MTRDLDGRKAIIRTDDGRTIPVVITDIGEPEQTSYGLIKYEVTARIDDPTIATTGDYINFLKGETDA